MSRFSPALRALAVAVGLGATLPMTALAQSSVTSTYGDLSVTIIGNGSVASRPVADGVEARLNDHLVMISDDHIVIDGTRYDISDPGSVVVDGRDGFSVAVDGTIVAADTEIDRRIAAAAAGDAAAQVNLGVAYMNGEGVDQDQERAVELYRMAADQGQPVGQSNLAYAYYNGRGVAVDYQQAMHWAGLAAEQGNAIAMRLVGFGHYYGRGFPQDRSEAARVWAEAAGLGDATAAYNMGIIVRDGDGVQQDDDLAILWFERALELGDEDAAARLAEMRGE
ncbi:tetratricopeptide repeat protein [Nioella nitratireducens]|uniref:tetratricopeptide repeat protein n=1 Tax=Nioella nitratireducens TaxID=1287720 RepID=UPI0008FD538A|nr:tetratricopeptide repeat protein [Nioella nitratireducens]